MVKEPVPVKVAFGTPTNFLLYLIFQDERFDIVCCYRNTKHNKKKNVPSLLYQFFDKILSPALLSKYMRPVVIVFFATLLAICIMFIPSIEIGLDQSLSMPKVRTNRDLKIAVYGKWLISRTSCVIKSK